MMLATAEYDHRIRARRATPSTIFRLRQLDENAPHSDGAVFERQSDGSRAKKIDASDCLTIEARGGCFYLCADWLPEHMMPAVQSREWLRTAVKIIERRYAEKLPDKRTRFFWSAP